MLRKIADPSCRLYPKVFWQAAYSASYCLSYGSSIETTLLPASLTSTWFGCHGFEKGAGWFFQPQELYEEPLSSYSVDSPLPLPSIIRRSDEPSLEAWKKNVSSVLEEIAKGSLKKVVLARHTTLTLASPLSPWDLLARMRRIHHPSTTLFLIQRSPSLAFIGATPETLFQRQGCQIQTMALAGTKKKGFSHEENRQLQESLLASPKERIEVNYVRDTLYKTLQTICSHVTMSRAPSILETSTLYHLLYSLSGELRKEIRDSHLLELLHPTPALGGVPREAALDYIKSIEPFARGWYGAPLGWFGSDRADAVVGIRSALIEGCQIHLYAGTGIVAGSDAIQEWEELEAKIEGFLQFWR